MEEPNIYMIGSRNFCINFPDQTVLLGNSIVKLDDFAMAVYLLSLPSSAVDRAALIAGGKNTYLDNFSYLDPTGRFMAEKINSLEEMEELAHAKD